ncbi:FAD-dependent oxidoreductase [Solihabitans fulvus]|uniref:FAD-dependent oxidoreductase n=1 Tax=Solihabitans fulvus TaxID=1892852 RepID=A0A5B2WTT1_9PSEU|nr:FAD-dependent monooxygenase [Solihabitans fulvus]KAA2253839.1 FAD-dependent oxidoreductase [Solihabitans fulvus]
MPNDVLIVGGGPNGLLLACELALAGVRPVVLERLSEPTSLPKANGLVGRVVQALHHRGLYELFTGNTTPPNPVPYFQFGGLPLDMSTMEGNLLYAVPVPQRRMEELLAQRTTELGVEIRRDHEVLAVRQDADTVTVEARGPEGVHELSARYLVGADGGRSAIRKTLGIGFPGITDDSFVVRSGQVHIGPPVAAQNGELTVPGHGLLRPATFTRTEHGMFAFGMFQPGVFRVSLSEWGQPPQQDSADLPIEELREAARRVLGSDLGMTSTGAPLTRNGSGTNSRLADQYRHGRVLLLGDAAHVQSGIGGPGLNLGMQDAINLGWKLAAEVRGWAPAGLLDTYQSERRPVGERVIMSSRAQTALLSPGPNVTALRGVLHELLGDATAVARISHLMAGSDVRYDMRATGPAHPLTGGWMPDLALDTETGPSSVAALMRTARPVLLDLAGRDDLVKAARDWADRVDVAAATSADRPADAVLVRPDGYVAFAADADTPDAADALRHALTEWFGEPAETGKA